MAPQAPSQAEPTPREVGEARRQGRTSSKPADPFIGHVLNNRFKIESKIGEGGFGAVYRGIQLGTPRKVAIKLLHPEMTRDPNLIARFRREGHVLLNLKDAHTITTYDFDHTVDGTLYIAMELLEGKSLHSVFQSQGPLDWRRVFKIIGEMCSSLAEAHQQGVVHRDLKPENVYLENRTGNPEFVKILDFGIAKVIKGEIDPSSPQLTATGQTLGTLEYMSPEQLMGKQLDGRSDVYALGVVAYEMITKRLPFPDAKGPAGLITAQLRHTPTPPSKANPNVSLPSVVDKIILKCLEKDKHNRYADVTALAAAVQEALLTAVPVAPAPFEEPPRRSPSAPVAVGPLAQDAGALLPKPSPLPAPAVPHLPPSPVPAALPQQLGSAPYVAPLSPMVTRAHGQPGASAPMIPTGAIVEPRSGPQPWVWVMVAVVALGAVAGAVLAVVL